MTAVIRMSAENTDGSVKQRSGWLIPVAVFFVTAALSVIVLLFYLAPTPASFIEEHAAPTTQTAIVTFSINGMKFGVPANYIMYANARKGSARKDVALFAIFPSFKGYSEDTAPDYSGNAADSPVIFLLLREEDFKISEAERLRRVYMTYVSDPAGKPGPFGLTQYTFRDDSGYHGEDLFVGQDAGHPVVLRCVQFNADVPSPSCLRDIRLGHDVALTYRFKRAHLGHWQDIIHGVDKLVASFAVK